MKIYSLNLAAYIKSKGYEYDLGYDERSRKHYFVFKEDVSEEIKEYRENGDLQKFIRSFKGIKDDIYN